MSSLYGVSQSIEQERRPPTKQQRKVLALMRDGFELVGHFDVWGGYWWTQQELSVTKRTVEGLLDRRLIIKLPNEHVYSGRQRIPFRPCS